MKVREGFVQSRGHQLAYLAVNEHLANDNEPAVVFIHGVLASVNFWLDCVPPEFREGRAWYSLSLPAHHPSTVPEGFKIGDVDDVWFFHVMSDALRELLSDRKAIIIGHSTGGFCALNLAIHQAPNVVGIVSVAGFHAGKWGGVEGLLLKLAGLGKWAKVLFAANIMVSKSSSFVRRIFISLLAHDSRAFRASPSGKRLLENIEKDVLSHDPSALFVLLNGIASIRIADKLPEINTPCHVFYGTHDPVVFADQSRVLLSEVPRAQSVAFEKVGHMPFIEDSEAYFSALEMALKDISGDGHTNQKTEAGN